MTPSQAALDMARQIIGQGAWDAIQGNKNSLTLVQGLARFEEQTRTATEREVVERWTCFHCGETFTDKWCARLHFGRDEDSEAACVIKAGAEGSLLTALRRAEEAADDAIQAMHNESTDAAKAYHSQRCRHNQALIAAEQLGYDRGLADGRAISEQKS